VFGAFLTWMQEKTSTVFVIATANDVAGLPPEFLRKGRFDEIFFVDLPTTRERQAVWALQLRRRLAEGAPASGMPIDDEVTWRLAGATEGYSGAEIEQAVVAGLFDAFAERRPLRETDLRRAVDNMVPLSVTQAEQIAAVRSWAATRAVAATATEDRSGYEAPRPPEPDSRGLSTLDPSRGGRLVDF